ncbi:hypothetical protein TWF694_008102 [Orbilia ellipsospora]|uniref:Uncharacterized protein n=1 Tax=Orbilia ellipsospora TaxID=2528407 RepID=A0AAV9XGM0_9PEZI
MGVKLENTNYGRGPTVSQFEIQDVKIYTGTGFLTGNMDANELYSGIHKEGSKLPTIHIWKDMRFKTYNDRDVGSPTTMQSMSDIFNTYTDDSASQISQRASMLTVRQNGLSRVNTQATTVTRPSTSQTRGSGEEGSDSKTIRNASSRDPPMHRIVIFRPSVPDYITIPFQLPVTQWRAEEDSKSIHISPGPDEYGRPQADFTCYIFRPEEDEEIPSIPINLEVLRVQERLCDPGDHRKPHRRQKSSKVRAKLMTITLKSEEDQKRLRTGLSYMDPIRN